MAWNRRALARLIFWPGLWLVLCLSARGAGRYTVVDAWGAGPGLLPQSSVISMVQTHDGYLWIGTYDGLARFDGVHFTVFDESSTPEMTSVQILKLFEDSRSNLWIGTESSGAMLVTNGRILKLELGKGRRKGHLVSVCEDSQGDVWMLTEDKELARYHDGNVDAWQLGGDEYTGGRAVIAENSGTVWVGTGHEMISIDPRAVRSNQALPAGPHLPINSLDYLLASRTGGYWRLSDGMIQKCFSNMIETLGPYPWGDRPVKAACEDRDGNLIVGTQGQGVFWFDAQGHATQICTTNSALANDNVLSLVLDSDGSLWVGMDGGGKLDRPLCRITRSIFALVDSTAGETIQSICEDQKGRVWFSPKLKDFCYWKDGVTTSVGSLGQLNPDAVLVDTNQNVWAATIGANLFRLQGARFQPDQSAAVLNPNIMALYEGHDGRIWAGTQGGLGCWNGQQWEKYTTNNGLSADIIRAITDDPAGDVWVGTEQGGLDLMRGGKVTCYQKAGGFPSDNISCLYLDDRGVLWVGTIGNGLIRLEHGSWKHYTTGNGLTGNSIDFIIEDGQGFLWIGSNTGLMRVRRADLDDFNPNGSDLLACRGYDKRDGLPANECTYGSEPAACRARDGTLWFPTIAGLVSVNPTAIARNTNPPPVVIESVYVDQQPQNTNGLRTAPPESVTVPAGRENLEIQFTSLNISAADQAVFRYELEGYQTKPTLPDKSRVARYLNLPHGNYTFRVQARNEDGVWNQTGATLAVIVLPPFWETWWFRAAVAGGLLGIIIATVHFISTQKLQRQLAGLRQQQALEKERARIARDIHDQVGASLTQLSLLAEMVQADKHRPDEAEGHARQISQTARETARELDEIVWTVNPSNDSVEGLINYICKHAQEYLAVAGLRYRLDVPTDLPATQISPEVRHNAFLAAKEAVTNVVRHARASEAWVRLRLAPQSFTLEVEDNGRGPGGLNEKAAESRNGLRNMRKRMEDIGGEFFIGPGPQGGTLVRLTVPLRNR